MAYRQLLQQVARSTLVMWFLAGCIAPITPPGADFPSATSTQISSTATAMPESLEPIPTLPSSTPTKSPTPISSSSPNVGHWVGEPSVSFELTSDGNIHNFSIDVPMQLTGDDCPVAWEEIINAGSSVEHHDFQCMPDSTQFCSTKTIEPDGTFTATALIKDLGPMTEEQEKWLKANNYWPTAVQTDVGEMYEATRISGKFASATAIAGTYKIHLCGDVFLYTAEEGTWSAEWQAP